MNEAIAPVYSGGWTFVDLGDRFLFYRCRCATIGCVGCWNSDRKKPVVTRTTRWTGQNLREVEEEGA